MLGFAFLFSLGALSKGVDLGIAPTWSSLAFALPLAMLAYTGLETVANLAAEIREPGKTLPRSLFAGIGADDRRLGPDRGRRALRLPGAPEPAAATSPTSARSGPGRRSSGSSSR